MLGEQKIVSVPKYTPRLGSFADVWHEDDGEIFLRRTGWVLCRETFHLQATDISFFLFYHQPKHTVAVAAFIHEFELRMGHRKLSEFGPCNINTITWVKPAGFWNRSSIRRGLFTILLRASMDYRPNKGNFEKALYESKFIKPTRLALDRFMEGHTQYQRNDLTNWCEAFGNASPTEVLASLARPPRRIPSGRLLDFALDRLNLSRAELVREYKSSRSL